MASTDIVWVSGITANMGSPTTVFAPADTRLSGALLTATALILPVGATALSNVTGIPTWSVGLSVTVGQVYYYQGKLYQVIKAHTTSLANTPLLSPTLWKVV
jgi:hypothetical protein